MCHVLLKNNKEYIQTETHKCILWHQIAMTYDCTRTGDRSGQTLPWMANPASWSLLLSYHNCRQKPKFSIIKWNIVYAKCVANKNYSLLLHYPYFWFIWPFSSISAISNFVRRDPRRIVQPTLCHNSHDGLYPVKLCLYPFSNCICTSCPNSMVPYIVVYKESILKIKQE